MTYPKLKTFFWGAILFQYLALGATPQDEVEFRSSERWYEVYLGKSKVGFAHSTMKLIDGKVRSESTFDMKIKRAGQVIGMKASERTVETPTGEILGFSGEILMAGIPITKEGTVVDGEIVVKEKQFFRETTKRYPIDPKGKMTWGLLKLLREKGFRKKGLTHEASIYSSDFGMAKPTQATVRTLGKEIITLGKRQVTAYKTEIEMASKLGAIKTTNWLDEEAIAVKTKMKMGGLAIEIRQSTETLAKKEQFIEEDFLLNSVIVLGSEIQPDASKTIFRLKVKEGSLKGITYEGKTQKIKRIDEQTMVIEVFSEDWKAILKGKGHPGQVATEFRESNILIDCDDVFVKNLARTAGRGAGNVCQIADKLCKFVSGYVSQKNFSVGFASASEVARKREGDCTEHGILLAAMGRAVGIPSRVATGLVYAKEFKGIEDALVYHMWTQFFLRGRWVNYDAALGKTRCPADRITLFVSSLKEDTLIESLLPTSELMGNLTVEKTD